MISILNRSVCGCEKPANLGCKICGYRYCSLECLVKDYENHKPRCVSPITKLEDLPERVKFLEKTQTSHEKVASRLGLNRDQMMQELENARKKTKNSYLVSFVVLKTPEAIEKWLSNPYLDLMPYEAAKKVLGALKIKSGANLPKEPPPLGMWVEALENGKKACKYMF